MQAKIEWQKDMHFKCFNNKLVSYLDATSIDGGSESFPSPKMLLLNSLMGCCAIDSLSTLKKMRMPIESFNVYSNAAETNNYPIHFNEIELEFKLTGEIKESKVILAITKSLSKYCGVSYMLSKSCNISYKIFLNQSLIHTDFARFD